MVYDQHGILCLPMHSIPRRTAKKLHPHNSRLKCSTSVAGMFHAGHCPAAAGGSGPGPVVPLESRSFLIGHKFRGPAGPSYKLIRCGPTNLNPIT